VGRTIAVSIGAMLLGGAVSWLLLPIISPVTPLPDKETFGEIRKLQDSPDDPAVLDEYEIQDSKRRYRAETLIGDKLQIITPEERHSVDWYIERGVKFIGRALDECYLILHHDLYDAYVAALGTDEIVGSLRYTPNVIQRTNCAHAGRAYAALTGREVTF